MVEPSAGVDRAALAFLAEAYTEEEIESAAAELEQRGRFRRTYELEARDTHGDVCARITTEVYVRIPREAPAGHSAF